MPIVALVNLSVAVWSTVGEARRRYFRHENSAMKEPRSLRGKSGRREERMQYSGGGSLSRFPFSNSLKMALTRF